MRLWRISSRRGFRPYLAIVQAGAEIGGDLVPPAFGGAERFEQFLLTDEIVLLVVARHAGIADRRHVLVAEAHDLAEVAITHAARAAPIREKFAGFLLKVQRLDLDVHLRRFSRSLRAA
jgi:hypothetical protein